MAFDLFDPQVLIVDVADRASVHAALVEWGPLTEAEVAATAEVGVDQVRPVLRRLAGAGRARRTSQGWEATGVTTRREAYRQGGLFRRPE